MIVMHSSSDLGECAGCAKWGPHFQFTHFNWAHVFGLRTFNNLFGGFPAFYARRTNEGGYAEAGFIDTSSTQWTGKPS